MYEPITCDSRQGKDGPPHESLAHVMSPAVLIAVFVALIGLHPLHAVVFLTALLILALFLSLTLLDTLEYRPDLRNWPT